MNQFRQDPFSGTWVGYAPGRAGRPTDFGSAAGSNDATSCPFCPGHESETPPEIWSDRPEGGVADSPGWTVRVFPNRFPIARPEAELALTGEPPLLERGAFGAHEVIVETPKHDEKPSRYSSERWRKILWVYRERLRALMADPALQAVRIFHNEGFMSGASLHHSHTQVVALPMIPVTMQTELIRSRRYQERSETDLFDDVLRVEEKDGRRIIHEGPNFLVFAPFASRSSYEIWIVPRQRQADYASIDEDRMAELGEMMSPALRALERVTAGGAYNILLQTPPKLEREDLGEFLPVSRWRIEIFPRLNRFGGYELATGLYVNTVTPEEAAEKLRGEWE